MTESVVILDFGSQYTQLIARRVREQKVFSKILPFHASVEEIMSEEPKGIILSGSPANVYDKKAPLPDFRIFDAGVPVLGICYGLQVISHFFKGKVHKSPRREYGAARLHVSKADGLLHKYPKTSTCWMSHGDKLDRLPKGFERLAHTANAPVAVVGDPERRIYGVQFHPEVVHTPDGAKIISNFLFRICRAKSTWTPRSFVEESVETIQEQVGSSKVVLGLSGGVDSSVAAVLIHKAIGKKLTCIFVDNGLLRLEEAGRIKKAFRGHFKMNMKFVDARKEFLTALRRVRSPEKKRKIIGHTFIDVFDRAAKKIGAVKYLAQGTLYPDVIESVSVFGGPTSMIKSHHNVGGLPAKMKLKLLEPLRMLFKDEVRQVGRTLGIPSEFVDRHPFPGPGLAVRILGDITEERLDLLKAADAIVIEEIKKGGFYKDLWQAFGVLLPIKSVGVMGDERTYENALAIRAVTSQDGMTADWAQLPHDFLGHLSNRIINEVRGINRVCLDISSKPPATIEWE
ncbi:MAG: glutamine-hydrolyzing GMP synthase [Candidatus Omnitrophota bacterium]|nr:glutamine-hydrolyzing GMP synthase [Candidatus Omnitrophota bacterium]